MFTEKAELEHRLLADVTGPLHRRDSCRSPFVRIINTDLHSATVPRCHACARKFEI